MSGFPPKPGTAAYRVLAHLETILPKRPRATAGMIAGELRGMSAIQVRDALEAAHEAGYVNREAERTALGRGPVFYELVRNTTGDFAVGGAGLRTGSVPPARREEESMLTGTGSAPPAGGIIEPVVDPNPAAEAPLLVGHDPERQISKVAAIRPAGEGFDVDLEQTPALDAWLRHGQRPGTLPEPFLAETPAPEQPVTVALDFAPGPDQFAVALASDGRLFCWRGSVPFVFTRAESRVLVQHLNLTDLDVLLDLGGGA